MNHGHQFLKDDGVDIRGVNTTSNFPKKLKKLKLDKKNTIGYDVQYVTKPILLIKGIGRLCECGCGKHLTSINKRQRFYSSTCRVRASDKHPDLHNNLLARLSINKKELIVYYKRGIKKTFKISPKHKEIWDFLETIMKYRGIKIER